MRPGTDSRAPYTVGRAGAGPARPGVCAVIRSRNVRCGLLLLQLTVICLLLYDHISLPCRTYAADEAGAAQAEGCAFRGLRTYRQPSRDKPLAWNNDLGLVQHSPERLFYNRVPKCGSHTFLDVIGQMSRIHNFTFVRAPEYMRFFIDEFWQMRFVARVSKIQTPMIYERHLHFVDFPRYGLEQPIYINIIRDPLERMISWYYFRRFQEGHIRNMTDTKRHRTFDECVTGNHSECVDVHGDDPEEGYFKMIPFFCGQQEFCREDKVEALHAAIRHVETHYLVVGVTEQFPAFIAALEHLLPGYFRGATSFYVAAEKQLKAKHRTVRKLVPSEQVVAIMRKKMKHEYAFYSFIRQKFNRLLDTLRNTPGRTENKTIAIRKR